MQKNFRGGVVWIELAPLGVPEFLAVHVCNGAGLPEDATRHPRRLLIDTLRDRHVLLVLDNCEHLIDACAPDPVW